MGMADAGTMPSTPSSETVAPDELEDARLWLGEYSLSDGVCVDFFFFFFLGGVGGLVGLGTSLSKKKKKKK